MGKLLPMVYFAVLVCEFIGLTVLYAVQQPQSGDLINAIIGTIGLGSMIVMLVYSIARRSRMLRNLARLSYWLHLHIFLGLQGVLLVAFHCLPIVYRDGPLVLLNPGMLNLYAVAVVFFSGIFGRYLYAQVPKTLGGRHLEAVAVEKELAEVAKPIPEEVQALWKNAPPATSFAQLIAADRSRRQSLRTLRTLDLDADVRALAERRLVLERQKVVMRTAQRIFHHWIILHRPIAAMMYLLTFVHVALALMFSPVLRF